MAGQFRPLEAGSWGGRNNEVTKSLAPSTTWELPALKTNRQMVTALLVQQTLLHTGEQSTSAPAHHGTQDCFCQKHPYFKECATGSLHFLYFSATAVSSTLLLVLRENGKGGCYVERVEYPCIFPTLPSWDTNAEPSYSAALCSVLHPILISPFPNADAVFA